MFFVSSQKGNLYGITDTTDGVEEFYTVEQILAIIKQGYNIEGVALSKGGYKGTEGCLLGIYPNPNFSKLTAFAAKLKFLGIDCYAIDHSIVINKIAPDKIATVLPNLPEGVTEFSKCSAMSGKSFLPPVVLPYSIEYVGEMAFMMTSGVSLQFKNPNVKLEKDALRHSGFNTIDLGNLTLKELPRECCSNSSGIYKVILPKTCKKIGGRCFSDDCNLISINTEDVVVFGKECFLNCTCLDSVHFGKIVKDIGKQAFKYNSNMWSVTFECETYLKKIIASGNYEDLGWFDSCYNIVRITLPKSCYHLPFLRSIFEAKVVNNAEFIFI